MCLLEPVECCVYFRVLDLHYPKTATHQYAFGAAVLRLSPAKSTGQVFFWDGATLAEIPKKQMHTVLTYLFMHPFIHKFLL